MLNLSELTRAVGRRVSAVFPVVLLTAILAFGNAVSAFGKTGNAPRNSRPKSSAASKRAAAEKAKAAEQASGADSSGAATQPPETKRVFKREGDPFLVATAEAPQQTPTPRPTPATPAQRDATRPPGSEQQQPVPPGSRTNPQDPTVPPGTTRPAPQQPPGPGVGQPVPPGTPRTTTQPPAETQTGTTPTTDPSTEELQEPDFPTLQPRPVPPMPSLSRVGVVSGDTLPLTLNEAVRRALENNNDIEVARADVRLNEQSLFALEGIYDPVFTYTPEYNSSIRPVPNVFGGADDTGTVSTTQYNNNVSVNKQFVRGGGNYTYFFNNTRETTSSDASTLNPFYSSVQGMTFTQPLWRNRSIDRNRREIRVQQRRLQQSDADFRRRTIDVISGVQRAYWDLVFALREEQNQIANLNLTRENFRRTEASVAAGAVAPLERAEVQTELSNRESALLVATQNVTIAENNLKNLLLKDPLSPEWSKVIVPTDTPTFDETPLNLETALKEARDNRPELRRLNLQEEINKIDIQYFKNQTKPQIDLTGTVSTTGLAGNPADTEAVTGPLILGDSFANTNASAFLLREINAIRGRQGLAPLVPPTITQQPGDVPSQFVGGYGRTLRNLFSLDTRNIVVGVTIQLPLGNKTAKANLAFAEIQREQLAATERAQEQVIEVEVRNAVQAVESSRRRVIAARQARESAEEQLAGERRLYQVGRSTTFLLFQRENQLVNARNLELRAETDYNKALAELQRVTSTTLRANNVLIESPIGK